MCETVKTNTKVTKKRKNAFWCWVQTYVDMQNVKYAVKWLVPGWSLVDWGLGRVRIGQSWPLSGWGCAMWAMSHLHTRVSQPGLAWPGRASPSLSCEYILILGQVTLLSSSVNIQNREWEEFYFIIIPKLSIVCASHSQGTKKCTSNQLIPQSFVPLNPIQMWYLRNFTLSMNNKGIDSYCASGFLCEFYQGLDIWFWLALSRP